MGSTSTPLCAPAIAHVHILFKGRYKKRCVAASWFLLILTWNVFWYRKLFQHSRWCFPPGRRFMATALWFHAIGRKRQWHCEAKIIDFASLSLAAWPMPGDFRETLVVFLLSISAATLISSCKTSAEFTTLWNEKKACNPVTQAAARLLGSWEKTCGTNPTVTKRTLCYLTVCGSHLIYSLFKMLCISQRRSQFVAHWFLLVLLHCLYSQYGFVKIKKKNRIENNFRKK